MESENRSVIILAGQISYEFNSLVDPTCKTKLFGLSVVDIIQFSRRCESYKTSYRSFINQQDMNSIDPNIVQQAQVIIKDYFNLREKYPIILKSLYGYIFERSKKGYEGMISYYDLSPFDKIFNSTVYNDNIESKI